MAQNLSKQQKKYIDQAIRRAEQQFNKWTKYEREYAEQHGLKPPKLNLPTRGEAYEKIDVSNGRNDYAKQIKEMSTVEVYQPKAYGKLKELGTSSGVKTFPFKTAVQIMRASSTGYAKTKKKDKKYTPIRNVLKFDRKTLKALATPEEEKDRKKRVTYLKNLRTKVEADLLPVNEELGQAIIDKLNRLIADNSGGSMKGLAEAEVKWLAKHADDATKEALKNTMDALEALDLGDFVTGFAEVVGYETFKDKLPEIVAALDLRDTGTLASVPGRKRRVRTWNGRTLEEIQQDLGKIT